VKKARKIVTGCTLIAFLAFAVISSVLAMQGCDLSTPRLNSEDRKRDIEFLAQWARDYSPFVDLNERTKGLPSYEKLRSRYVDLAKNAKDNTEFLQIVYGYASLIGASGHFYISKGADSSWLGEPRPAYWHRILSQNCIVHPPFRVARSGGLYVTRTDYEQDGTRVPKGSQVLTVNGMACRAYLEHVRSGTWARVVPGPTENLDRKLLLVNEGAHFKGWRVDFLRPDRVVASCVVPARQGPNPSRSKFLDTSSGNCICLVLTQSVGYIRIKTLAQKHVWPDREKIHLFLARAVGGFSKLIIDLRDNGGGCTEYIYENLMKRFLKQPVSYKHITGVRRKFIEDHSRAYIDSKLTLDPIHGGETSVDEVEPPQGFDSSEWVFYEISRELEPQNRYPFEGDIFVLINRRTGSAADNFANAVKRIGMATLVGQSTHGSCAGYLGPIAVRLPESGMEFMLEADLLINPDGTYNEITGTPPDVRLPLDELPEAVTKDAILDDPWIRKIISDL